MGAFFEYRMSKELRETRIWLLIIVRDGLIKPASKLDVLIR